MEGTQEKKRIKPKIGVGSLVNAKTRNMEENKSERIISKIREEMVGCVQSVVGNNISECNFKMGR